MYAHFLNEIQPAGTSVKKWAHLIVAIWHVFAKTKSCYQGIYTLRLMVPAFSPRSRRLLRGKKIIATSAIDYFVVGPQKTE